MRKIALLTITSLLASIGSSSAALVNILAQSFAGAAPKMVVTSAGAQLPTGSVVRIGTFPNGVPASLSSFAQVNAAFVPLGESAEAADGTNGPLTVNNVTSAGHFAGPINNVDNSDSRFGAGTRLYIMVLNAPFASMGSASEWAIMSDAGFTIPSSGATTLTTSAIDSQAEVFAGTWAANQIRMAPIPEPSTGLLGLLAVAGLMARRRR